MTEILVLRKIFGARPQQFMLVLKDSVKGRKTEFGGETEMRTMLKAVGVLQPQIDELFAQAKSK